MCYSHYTGIGKPFFPPIDIQRTQCPREASSVVLSSETENIPLVHRMPKRTGYESRKYVPPNIRTNTLQASGEQASGEQASGDQTCDETYLLPGTIRHIDQYVRKYNKQINYNINHKTVLTF